MTTSATQQYGAQEEDAASDALDAALALQAQSEEDAASDALDAALAAELTLQRAPGVAARSYNDLWLDTVSKRCYN